MSIANMQDVLYLVGAIALTWITVFLCWVLYEAGRLVHQANELVSDTREKVSRIERMLMNISEKFGNVSQYLGFIAEGGKQVLSFFQSRKDDLRKPAVERKGKKKSKRDEVELSDWEE